MKKSKKEVDLMNPIIEEPEELIKSAKIYYTGRQYMAIIPAVLVEALNLKKGDALEFKINLKKGGEPSIKLKHG